MSKTICETCSDRKVLGYYGLPVVCADCSDELTIEQINVIWEESNQKE